MLIGMVEQIGSDWNVLIPYMEQIAAIRQQRVEMAIVPEVKAMTFLVLTATC